MNVKVPYKLCRRCDDKFYNEGDIKSIIEAFACVNCAKEIKFKKELVELKRKKLIIKRLK